MDVGKLLGTAQNLCRLAADRPVVVGVSGGADSLSLMAGLVQAGYEVVAAHFDHRLRVESGEEAGRVAEMAGRLGAAFASGGQDVYSYAAAEGLSIEEAARMLRYRFLFEQARLHGAQAVAVGHTADDQVETVLMHLLRGSGLAGLSGMRFRVDVTEWDANVALVRPLLGFWREETVAFCRACGLTPLDDPSNSDRRFLRNRIRHELIPLLETYNPQAREALWRMARGLAGDLAIVEERLEAAWELVVVERRDNAVILSLERLRGLPEGLQRRVLRRAAGEGGRGLRDLDFDVVERVLRAVERDDFRGRIELVHGLEAAVEGERLIVRTGGGESPGEGGARLPEGLEGQALPAQGRLALAGGWELVSETGERPPEGAWEQVDGWEAWLDADSLPGPLAVRQARRGDRFQPLGMAGHSMKLSDFWINQKVPREARAGWPLVVSGEAIVWVPGFRLAEPFRVQQNTRRVVRLRLHRVPSS